MPTTMHVIRADEFIRLNAQGKLDLAETRRVFAQLSAVLGKRGLAHAVVDFRKVAAANLSVADLYDIASTFEEAGFRRSDRLALLYPPGGDKANFLSLCASNRGWQMAAFPDLEQAMDWLFRAEAVEPETELAQPSGHDQSSH